MEPTKQQNEIVSSIGESSRIKVIAFAGTGKTTTLKLVAEKYPHMRFLYLAFNKSIAKEASRKFPDNVDVYTTHSFALKHTKDVLGIKKVRGDYKTKEIKEKFDISDMQVADIVNRVLTGYCYSSFGILDQESIKKLIFFEDKQTRLLFFALIKEKSLKELNVDFVHEQVKKVWDEAIKGDIDITHNIYLKYFQMQIGKYSKGINYDVVMLDEAQDTNNVTLAILDALPGKKIIVGDAHQQIYGFRKTVNAMKNFQADTTLCLSKSFRIPQSVAEKATWLLQTFLGEQKGIESNKGERKGSKERCV